MLTLWTIRKEVDTQNKLKTSVLPFPNTPTPVVDETGTVATPRSSRTSPPLLGCLSPRFAQMWSPERSKR